MESIMKTVFVELKKSVCVKQLESQKIRREINDLRWKSPESSEIARNKIVTRDPVTGHRLFGKRALKELKCPESGSQRHSLRLRKLTVGSEARHIQLAYAMFRGRAYKTVENKCVVLPDSWTIGKVFEKLLAKELRPSREVIASWLKGEAVNVFPKPERKVA